MPDPNIGQLAATHFLDDVLEHNAEGCNYLLAVDVDMNTVDGYAMSSWDRGYGDFVFKPDLSTLRRVPWHEGTALVLADLMWSDHTPVVAIPVPSPTAPTSRIDVTRRTGAESLPASCTLRTRSM